jgi:hypothetical protein
MHTGRLTELDNPREHAEFHLPNLKLMFQLITLRRTSVLSWVLSSFKSLPSMSLVAGPFLGSTSIQMWNLHQIFFVLLSINFREFLPNKAGNRPLFVLYKIDCLSCGLVGTALYQAQA